MPIDFVNEAEGACLVFDSTFHENIHLPILPVLSSYEVKNKNSYLSRIKIGHLNLDARDKNVFIFTRLLFMNFF